MNEDELRARAAELEAKVETLATDRGDLLQWKLTKAAALG